MRFYNGLKIIESPLIVEIPKLQLSQDFTACSESMKQSMNAWLKEKFGTYMPVYMIGNASVAMHPKHVAVLRKEKK